MTAVANFTVEYMQYLNAESKVIQPLPDFAKDHKILLDLYRYMVLTRIFDAKAIALQRTGKMGTYPSSLGQEAVAVGMGHVMAKEDVFCPYYRDQGALLIRGVKMQEILTYWGGDERGSDYQEPRQDFPIAIPVASQCLHAAGCAYAIKYRKEKRAVVTTVGDGGTSKGDFYEAMNLAGDWNLPIVFVINNNQWAISVPLSLQTASETLAQKAIAAGFEGVQVDGNDVIAVRDAVSKALIKAKEGLGPSLIEAVTYRLCDHTTADDARRYVEPHCIDEAWKLEPIKRLYRYFLAENLWSDQQEQQLLSQLNEEVELAVKAYLDLPSQPATAMLSYLYKNWPENLQDQLLELGAIENA